MTAVVSVRRIVQDVRREEGLACVCICLFLFLEWQK